MQEIPEAFGTESGEGVFDLHGTAKTKNVFGVVGTGDSVPAGIGAPLIFERFRVVSLLVGHRRFLAFFELQNPGKPGVRFRFRGV